MAKVENYDFVIKLAVGIILFILIISWQRKAWANGDRQDEVPSRYGMAAVLGKTYDPTNDIDFLLVSGCALYDYDRVWPHRAPEPLRFKVEYSLGATLRPHNRIMASVGMLALYYLDNFSGHVLRPYVEAGIGIIYTDFQVEGQGLRVNFNPQAGIGIEFPKTSKLSFFTSLRLHHLSNGDLYRDNRGINSIVLVLGRFF